MGRLAFVRTIALIAATVLALSLAACGEKDEPEPSAPSAGGGTGTGTGTGNEGGGGGDGSGGGGGGQKLSPEQLVETTVVTVIGGGDPNASCGELVTPRYVKSAYGDEQGCRAATSKQSPVDVTVSAIKISGSGARASAKPQDGPNKGETIAVTLVNEGKTWKVDSARSNAPPGP